MRSQPEVAQRFRERFKVIMVDEYQDANVAQFQLLKELCSADTYVCVVGDDDQSIYRFRGAEVKNILEFPDRFSGADIIRLEQNYRSTDPILKAASSVVDYNQGRLGKTLRAEKTGGSLPVLAYLPDQDAEAAFCAEKISSSVKSKKTTWADWAILYRTNAQSACFETLFLRKGIPYRVVGSLKFYEREEVKDAIALLAFVVNPRDEVSFRRVVNKPTRGVGGVTIDKIVEAAIENGGDLIEAGEKIELSKKARTGLDEFCKVINNAKKLLGGEEDSNQSAKALPAGTKKKSSSASVSRTKGLKSGEGLSICIEKLLIDSRIAEYHKEQDETAGNSKMNNLQELLNGASEYSNDYEGLLKFLEDIELDRSLYENINQNDQNVSDMQDAVTLITFHNTKGLEFKCVIMTGLEHGIFPREDKKEEELEEERRLFYVGATRAMDELYLTNCKERRMFGRTLQSQPSLFLREMDRNFLQIEHAQTGKQERKFINQPRSFNPFNMQNASVSGASPSNAQISKELEERAGWRRGQRLFHEDNGYGAVMDIKDSEDGPVVRVRFDSGQEKRFLSEIQGRAFEKVDNDC